MAQPIETPERFSATQREGRGRRGMVVAGTYRVLGLLGSGSMGEVFEAEHVRLGSRVAMKFLHDGALADPRAVLRFQREARAVAGVRSEHVVRVFDCGELPDGAPYLVMERLFGEDLRSLLARTGALPLLRALRLVTDACQGLAAVHEAGVVHRDLKPANLFVTRHAGNAEICKILDFGVAKLIAVDGTQNGSLLGTLRYMAPEQVEDGAKASTASDIYALAAILYECLAGAPAHAGATMQQTMFSILNGAPRPLADLRSIPPELGRIVHRALSQQPKDRPASARELFGALRPFVESGEVGMGDSATTLIDESVDVAAPSRAVRARGLGLGRSLSLFATFALGSASGALACEVFVGPLAAAARGGTESAPVCRDAPPLGREVVPEAVVPALQLPIVSTPPALAGNAATAAGSHSGHRSPDPVASAPPSPRRAPTAKVSERFDAANPYAD
jgi:eukaryotic-like serine/threonine-protein kinase